MLYPQVEDGHLLGYPKPPLPEGSSPHALLSEGYALIKSLLVSSEESSYQITPLATRLFTFCKAVGLQTSFGTVDIEWTKHKLRRLAILSAVEGRWELQFPKPLHKCRLTLGRTQSTFLLKPQAVLDLQKNTQYFLDHFE